MTTKGEGGWMASIGSVAPVASPAVGITGTYEEEDDREGRSRRELPGKNAVLRFLIYLSLLC